MVRSRKRKATEPVQRGQVRTTNSNEHGGTATGGGQVRQSVFDMISLGNNRNQYGEEERNSVRYSHNVGGRVASSEWHGNDSAVAERMFGSKASFYVTNFPDNTPLIRLRQAFEVCGILTDVYVVRFRNARGQEFGFVRYVNVKNKVKLSQALNNVWIGQNRVWAREAKYDRFSHNDIVRVDVGRTKDDGKMEVAGKAVMVDRDSGEGVIKVRLGKVVVGEHGEEGKKLRLGFVEEPVVEKGRKWNKSRAEESESSGQGSLVVMGRKHDENKGVGKKDESVMVKGRLEVSSSLAQPAAPVAKQILKATQFIPVYKSRVEDLSWASSGMVASIFLEDSVLALQQRMEDAWFGYINVIPIGGDRFFLNCTR